MSTSQLPDDPAPALWNKWLERHCNINEAEEENLMRAAGPDGICISCQWWRSYSLHKDLCVLENGDVFVGGDLIGDCVRFPPTAADNELVASVYPTTTSTTTCGEWKIREHDGKQTSLTKIVDGNTAWHRRSNGETARTYRDGSVTEQPKDHLVR